MDIGLGETVRRFGQSLSNNLALSMIGIEIRPFMEALIGSMGDDDIVFAVTNSIDIADRIPKDVLQRTQKVLLGYETTIAFVTRDGNFEKFMYSVSPHYYQLLSSVPGGMEWAARQILLLSTP